MPGPIDALYDDLSRVLGLQDLPREVNESVQLTIGGDVSVVLFGRDDRTLLIACPVGQLPDDLDRGTALLLLRRNLYDSKLTPFCLGCDANETLIFWGTVTIEGASGEGLAGLLDTVAAEVGRIRADAGIVSPLSDP